YQAPTPMSKKRDLAYAVNPSEAPASDDPLAARLRRRRKNPAELVVIENPAPPKRRAGEAKARPTTKEGKRGAASGRKSRPRAGFVSPTTQPPAIMATKSTTRKNGSGTRRKNSTRRNPA